MTKYLVVTGIILNFARVFESRDGGMVDTRDLKSLDQEWLCGFESRSRHRYLSRPSIGFGWLKCYYKFHFLGVNS